MTEPNDLNDLDAQLLAQMREDFLAESGEILDRLGSLLTELEQTSSSEVINSIFRDIHTLKGTAGFVGLSATQRLAHKMEDVFGAVRAEQLAVTPELIDLAFAGVQQLSAMREDVLNGGSGEANIIPLAHSLEAALQSPESIEGWSEVIAQTATTPETAAVRTETTLRVEVDTLDTLMLLVGELITARNALLAIAERLKDGALTDNSAAIGRLTRQLQEAVTSVRLVPVERLYRRFVPVVRNMARERGKQVRLVIEGGDTPLDRSVSEQMYDPLIHLLRNAIDHGLEPTPDRRRAGKPDEGTIRLSAERRGDDVILRVADDGAGIDPARLRRVAVERGLYSAEEAAALTDKQAIRLIFAAGFSTATVVSDVSGRGVGMDVVTQNVRRLRGTVDVETSIGQGTTFVIKMPLTLAILQVMLVRVGGYTYALPLYIVRETLQLSLDSIQTMQQGEVVFIRNTALPVRFPIADFGLSDIGLRMVRPGSPQVVESPPVEEIRNPQSEFRNGLKPAVVVHLTRGDEVLVVDELMGKQQVVIKPLNPYLGEVQGVEGAAILPDGSVTLILDVDGLGH